MSTECLIVGAGPTGLALAIELRRFGLLVRLVDKANQPARWSQALVIQARTLEQFDRYGIADQAVSQGRKVTKAHVWSDKRRIASLGFNRLPSRFPYLLFLPQNETEHLLTEHLRSLGVEIERGTELIGLERPPDDSGVTAQLRHSDGSTELTRFRWLIGCDGAHSTVRARMGTSFEGVTSSLHFLLGDLRLSGEGLPGDDLQVHLHHGGDVLALGRLRADVYRVVLALNKQPPDDQQRLPELDDFNAAFKRSGLRFTAESATWRTPFSVNQRKAARYRQGSVFLAGDAAHIHSPVGGQGMNTGIQDVANLAWKLAAVEQGADVRLLDSYDEERGNVGEHLLRGTSLGLRLATISNPLLRRIRDSAIQRATQFQAVQEVIARTISEISIKYRASSIVRTEANGGSLKAGDRMPDAVCKETGRMLLADLRKPVHLLVAVNSLHGELPEGLKNTAVLTLNSQSCEWAPSLRGMFGKGSNLYLVRPDGYIGFAGKSAENLRKYAELIGLL